MTTKKKVTKKVKPFEEVIENVVIKPLAKEIKRTDKFKTTPVAKKIKEENEKQVRKLKERISLKEKRSTVVFNEKGDIVVNSNKEHLKKEFDELEVPTLRKIHKKPKISLIDKITWVLTAVNVAILISLVIRNV